MFYKIFIEVKGIENAGSCSDENQRIMYREGDEDITVGICRWNAALNAQKYYEGKQQEYRDCHNQDDL